MQAHAKLSVPWKTHWIYIERIYITQPVESGAWNRALEKLTSAEELARELRDKGYTRTREVVKKLFA